MVHRVFQALLVGPSLALVTGALALGEGLGGGLAVMEGHGNHTLVMGVTRERGCLTLIGPLLGVGGEALEVRLGGRVTLGMRVGRSLFLDGRLRW